MISDTFYIKLIVIQNNDSRGIGCAPCLHDYRFVSSMLRLELSDYDHGSKGSGELSDLNWPRQGDDSLVEVG
ncbi:hypothetical protein FRX31_012844 [Thalictrum thalictroides]|uniref:Uncharacterized protein n=1 Tax=Thalictrum thalictroides TaxID=46969 RepID=A0A7J6WJL1_THATH|nr:hypothetical protein FRX31_012844 [Thalictrum thalictroides]